MLLRRVLIDSRDRWRCQTAAILWHGRYYEATTCTGFYRRRTLVCRGTFRALRRLSSDNRIESHSSSRPNTFESGGSAASKHEDNVRLFGLILLTEFQQASRNSFQCIPKYSDNLMFIRRLHLLFVNLTC